MNWPKVLATDLQGCLAISRGEHSVPLFLQGTTGQAANLCFIFNQKNGFVTANIHRTSTLRYRFAQPRVLYTGEVKPKSSPTPHITFDFDQAVVLFHNPKDGGEA